VTDRPDQTESAVVVPRGSVQVEAGLQGARDDEGERREVLEGPSTLVRLGVAEGWELRLGWDGVVREEVAGRTVADGAGDAELGLKLRLPAASGLEAALLAGLSLPVGEDGVSSGRADPSVRLALARDLTPDRGLGVNLGLARTSAESPAGRTRTETDAFYSVVLGLALAPRWGAFVESFGEVGLTEGAEGPRHALDGGVTWLLRDRLQLDAFVGVGLSSAADDWFAGAGLSVRWDKEPRRARSSRRGRSPARPNR